MFLHITALLCGAEIRGAALVGISTYAFYMLNQHRRVFVLGLAPDLICFFRYCTSAEDFLKWVQEAELTLPEMERSFWENFWAPYTIGAATAVFLVLAAT